MLSAEHQKTKIKDPKILETFEQLHEKDARDFFEKQNSKGSFKLNHPLDDQDQPLNGEAKETSEAKKNNQEEDEWINMLSKNLVPCRKNVRHTLFLKYFFFNYFNFQSIRRGCLRQSISIDESEMNKNALNKLLETKIKRKVFVQNLKHRYAGKDNNEAISNNEIDPVQVLIDSTDTVRDDILKGQDEHDADHTPEVPRRSRNPSISISEVILEVPEEQENSNHLSLP